MIIDFHTHCFPDTVAEKALPKLSGIGGIPYHTNGTIASNLEAMDREGVDISVVLSIATNPKQTTNVNNFALEINRTQDRIIALGSVNPDSEPEFIDSELERLRDGGVKGIKIHPDYMGHTIDDSKFDPIFAKCCELDLFVATHAGWDFISPDFIHATPERIARVLDKYPSLRLIGAHMGSFKCEDAVLRLLCGRENFWFDTSLLSQSKPDPKLVREIIMNHDPKRILFGSDTPWCKIGDELDYIKMLELPCELYERIMHKNAEELLGI